MEQPDPLRHWNRCIWGRYRLLRRFYRWIVGRGFWCVVFDGTDELLWREAARHAPPSYRWFGRSLDVAEIDEECGRSVEWQSMKRQMRPGDRIWPFLINPDTTAMRVGYVLVRAGRGVGGVITLVS